MATLVAICAGTARSQPNPDSTAGTQFFDESVSEILTKRCIRCHNPSKTSGGLDLTSNAGLTAGGNSGLVVNRKAPEQSVLIKLVEHREKPRMPLDQPKLPDSDIQNLKKWIFYGSPYSRNLSAPTAAKELVKVDRSFWSFRRLSPVKTPQAGSRGPPIRLMLLSLNNGNELVYVHQLLHRIPNFCADSRWMS